VPPVNAATEEMNKIRPDPGSRMEPAALGEQERGAQVLPPASLSWAR
jgi:hypothetical protein